LRPDLPAVAPPVLRPVYSSAVRPASVWPGSVGRLGAGLIHASLFEF
jgi:hypothetical protein